MSHTGKSMIHESFICDRRLEDYRNQLLTTLKYFLCDELANRPFLNKYLTCCNPIYLARRTAVADWENQSPEHTI